MPVGHLVRRLMGGVLKLICLKGTFAGADSGAISNGTLLSTSSAGSMQVGDVYIVDTSTGQVEILSSQMKISNITASSVQTGFYSAATLERANGVAAKVNTTFPNSAPDASLELIGQFGWNTSADILITNTEGMIGGVMRNVGNRALRWLEGSEGYFYGEPDPATTWLQNTKLQLCVVLGNFDSNAHPSFGVGTYGAMGFYNVGGAGWRLLDWNDDGGTADLYPFFSGYDGGLTRTLLVGDTSTGLVVTCPEGGLSLNPARVEHQMNSSTPEEGSLEFATTSPHDITYFGGEAITPAGSSSNANYYGNSTMDALTNEQAIQIKVRNYASPNTGTARLMCRNGAGTNLWEFRCANIGLGASQAISLWEVNSGSYTARGSTSGVTFTAGTTWTMRLRCPANYVTGSVNANNGVFQLGYASTQHNTNNQVVFGSFHGSTSQHAWDDLLILPIASAWDTELDSF